MILAIIPARGGSKGVKRKNIRSVGCKPLIYWSIDAAQQSESLKYVFVTTDDKEIAEVSSSFGAEIIMRPESLAADKTPMLPVLQFVCEKAEEKLGEQFNTIVLLQPTAPMRTAKHIDQAIAEFEQTSADSMVSVYKVDDCHPSRMYRINQGTLEKIYEEPAGSLRQDLESIYHRNGALYICKRDLLMNEGKLVCDNPTPFIMSKSDSANIDDEDDLKIADFLMTERNNKK